MKASHIKKYSYLYAGSEALDVLATSSASSPFTATEMATFSTAIFTALSSGEETRSILSEFCALFNHQV